MKHALIWTALLLTAMPAAAETPGLLMLEDFSTVSSWLGGPRSGGTPGAVAPFDFSFGSVPDATRDDGFAGELRFDFAEPNGVAGFAKNEVYQTLLVPRSIRYALDAQGWAGEISFVLRDRNGKSFTTRGERFSGTGWRNFQLPVDAETVPGYGSIAFPVGISALQCRMERPGKGGIRIDDLAAESDVSGRELVVHNRQRRLAFAPGEAVRQSYLVRNSLGREVTVEGTLKVSDGNGTALRTVRSRCTAAPFGSAVLDFDLGTFAESGAYACELEFDNRNGVTRFLGWLGVFRPNGGRVNRRPMYFSVEDQEINTAPYEAAQHAEWVKLLGVDMVRAAMLGVTLQPLRGSGNFDKYRAMWKPYREAGLLLQLDYAATVAPWTVPPASRKGPWINSLDCDWELFREHMEAVADFIASMPEAKYFEWYNEPDLGGYKGTAENYYTSLRILYPILKAKNPRLRITTGGVTIDTPHGKTNFVRDLLRDHADCFDVAAFHEHAGFRTYQDTVEKVVGLTGGKKPLANTEAGYRSYQGRPDRFYEQAGQLIRKIAWSKAKGLEFYNWFMLQDYWDKYINADDSFGLVTVENQPKPAFVAYNELIRQLAGLDPAEAVVLDARLGGCRFVGNGEEVHVLWPNDSEVSFPFIVRSSAEIERIDAFGARKRLKPENGVVMVESGRLPFYLRCAEGALRPLPPVLEFAAEPVGAAGRKLAATLLLRNPYPHPVGFRMIAGGDIDRGELPPWGERKLPIAISVPESARPGVRGFPVYLELSGVGGKSLSRSELSLPYRVAFPVYPEVRGEVRLENEAALTELIFDPSVPRWSGSDDLSAVIRLNWEREGLRVSVDVRDQDHSTPREDAAIWQNDAVQFAFAAPGREMTEFTVSGGKSGARAWCHLSPDPNRIGRLELPDCAVVRENGVTRYRLSVPWGLIGIAPAPGGVFGMSVLVCDNDANRRLRLMNWGEGIEGTKDPRRFNRLLLLGQPQKE